ncbi:MAG: PfkB family carbohydrate kinase [Azospirillaceae bacterium]|nr:PfkB family carbohydrate kinase [Azospirillaceae bacterium]
MTVHVVGNVCIDTTLHVGRFPVPGETLVARSSRSGVGGKGLNQAVAAARAGALVVLHAAIGHDAAAARIQAVLSHEPLALDLVVTDVATDSSMILVRDDGENLIVSDTRCARAFDPRSTAGLVGVGPGDIVLLQGNLGAVATADCLRRARRASALTVFNPSPLDDGRAFDWPLVDLVIANRGEIAALTGAADPEVGAAALRIRGAGAVAVTLGGDGVLLCDGGGSCRIAAVPVVPLDTSGAGDVLCGVAVGLLAQGMAADAAFARAAAAAALAVGRPGAFESCPSAAELRLLVPTATQRREI